MAGGVPQHSGRPHAGRSGSGRHGLCLPGQGGDARGPRPVTKTQAPKNHLRRSPLPHPLCLVLSASFCTAHGFARHVAAGCKDGGAAGEPGYGSAGWEVRERLSRLASAASGFGLLCSGELSGISKPCHQCPGNCAQGDCKLVAGNLELSKRTIAS